MSLEIESKKSVLVNKEIEIIDSEIEYDGYVDFRFKIKDFSFNEFGYKRKKVSRIEDKIIDYEFTYYFDEDYFEKRLGK